MDGGESSSGNRAPAGNNPFRLAILLPITSRGCTSAESLLGALAQLRSSLDPPPASAPPPGAARPSADPWATRDRVCIVLGIDADDELLMPRRDQLLAVFAGLPVRLVVFTTQQLAALPPGPLCWMWDQLAQAAVRELRASHAVLLGDDIRMEPQGWPRLVADAFAQPPPPPAPQQPKQDSGPADHAPSSPCALSPAAASDASPAAPVGGTEDDSAPCRTVPSAATATTDPHVAASPATPAATRAAAGSAATAAATAPSSTPAASPSAPPLRCLLLLDAADPGYPSFPVLHVEEHLRVFGSLFPPGLFVNQVGDPFLAELYRRLGCCGLMQHVVVHNGKGGIQLPDQVDYVAPRYPRAYPPVKQVLQALDAWAAQGRRAWGGARCRTSVDVLVPCGRGSAADMACIVEGVLPTDDQAAALGVDVRVAAVVDVPPHQLDPAARAALLRLRDGQPGRVRLRFAAANRGASRTRNRLLDESLGQLVMLLDDDVVPERGLVGAYVEAARKHPEARGFAGPTHLPAAGSTWAHAVHMSDVAFFWQAPGNDTLRADPASGARWVPWAVTANLAVRNTHQRFDARFPRTGGGEDIDFCLRAAPGGMLAVPQAKCSHPLWNNGRPHVLRFSRWAIGDGQLIEMYPRLTYRAAPNTPETLLLLATLLAAACSVLVAARGVGSAMAWVAAAAVGGGMAAADALRAAGVAEAAGAAAGAVQQAAVWVAAAAARVAVGAVAAAVGVVAAEVALEMLRHCANKARLARHPCPDVRTRLAAALRATLIRNVSEAGRLYGHVSRAFGFAAAPGSGAGAGASASDRAGGSKGESTSSGGVRTGGMDATSPAPSDGERAVPSTSARSTSTVSCSGGEGGGEGGSEGGLQGGGVLRVLRLYGMRFDWFCGIDACIVRMERYRAAARAAVHWTSGGALAAWALGGWARAQELGAGAGLAGAVMAVWVVAGALVVWKE